MQSCRVVSCRLDHPPTHPPTHLDIDKDRDIPPRRGNPGGCPEDLKNKQTNERTNERYDATRRDATACVLEVSDRQSEAKAREGKGIAI